MNRTDERSPSASQRDPDDWTPYHSHQPAHSTRTRRVSPEPRLFALGCTIYLLAAVAISLSWIVKSPSLADSAMAPAARSLVIWLSIGFCVLWPLIRLSQSTPPRGETVVASFEDLLVVIVPVQAVIWSFAILAELPTPTTLGLASTLAAWIVFIGGILALTFSIEHLCSRGKSVALRCSVMFALIAMATLAPALFLIPTLRADIPSWFAAASPLSVANSYMGRGWHGPERAFPPQAWGVIIITVCAGMAIWLCAVLLEKQADSGNQRIRQNARPR
jgi:hypothetical protein